MKQNKHNNLPKKWFGKPCVFDIVISPDLPV